MEKPLGFWETMQTVTAFSVRFLVGQYNMLRLWRIGTVTEVRKGMKSKLGSTKADRRRG